MICINLAGLHRKVYRAHPKISSNAKGFHDLIGSVSWKESTRDDGLFQLVFKEESHAKAALQGAEMVADFIISRLVK